MKTPILETPRLFLRPFCSEDAAEVFECWEKDPDVARYMFWCSHNDISITKEWIKQEVTKIPEANWYRWAVVERGTMALVGTGLIYYEEEYDLFEVGYNLGKQYWGKGYATEMMEAVMCFAQEVLHLKEIVGRCAKDNISSAHVLEKLGFVYEKDILYEANEGKMKYMGTEYRWRQL